MVKLSSKSDYIVDQILSKLGLSGGAIRVYAKLSELKEANAKRLADATGIARTSVYDYVLELEKLGLVVELDVNNKKVFKPDDPDHLLALLDKRVHELEIERKSLKKLLPQIKKGMTSGEPRVKFYPGAEGFVAVLADVVRSGVSEALFLWPFGEMTERIGEDYLRDFTQRRLAQGIAIRSIWPHFVPTKNRTTRGTPQLDLPRERVRVAPASCKWDMGAVIYGDKVAFVSSRSEGFAFTVQSHDFAQLQKMQFEKIWELSRPLRAKISK